MTIRSKELRSHFLQYFAQHGHFIEKSAPLIPQDDPTLLFVNAGMVQFKNVFTKKEIRPYKTAATSQKCMRAGGKHNDLENVGQTTRHHTFFEMLGNFSFGDYFKEKAITLAWDFLVKELKLDKNRLSVSVFAGDEQVPADIEAENIWHKVIGLPKEKIKRLGRADNFWQMGDTGPCGPCSEIHYDRSDINISFGAKDADEKNIEIWNLVFMQYEQQADGSLISLPAPSIDTGMGLERLCAIVNQMPSNYDTDLLRPFLAVAEKLSQKSYQSSDSESDISLRVIADHCRSTAFLVADGLFPSNEGRGYVLRRIMRRAIRHGARLGINKPFFHEVCLAVVKEMGSVYKELEEASSIIEKVVFQEEEAFRKTLDRGLILFEEQTKNLKAGAKLDGSTVFRLHETFGFPADLTENLAKEQGFSIDWKSFEEAKKIHEDRSASTLGLKGIDEIYLSLSKRLKATKFLEQNDEASALEVMAIIDNGQEVNKLSANKQGIIILDRSPFYGESGGQIGDIGTIKAAQGMAKVLDTKKIAGLHLHYVEMEQGEIAVAQLLSAKVDWLRRKAIMRNHSATHLLHSALRKILGPHVSQKGSLVAPDRLRFDFSHFESLSEEQIQDVEDLVNSWILENEKAQVRQMTPEEAKTHGALALFGEKYGDSVRVLNMGSHSIELCGGTHVSATGDIGPFKITTEGPLALGIRRMEAITGLAALALARTNEHMLRGIAHQLNTSITDIPSRLNHTLSQLKNTEKILKAANTESSKSLAKKAAEHAITVGTIKLVLEDVSALSEAKELRPYADLIRDHLQSGVVVLGLKENSNQCVILVAATKDLANTIHAGKIIGEIAPIIGGKGGGRPDFAQAGGSNTAMLKEALKKAQSIIENVFINVK